MEFTPIKVEDVDAFRRKYIDPEVERMTAELEALHLTKQRTRHWFDRMCGVYEVETPPERTTIAAFFIGAALALGSLAYVLSFYVSAHG